MLDLDKLMATGLEVKILGKEITVLEPTAKQFKRLDKLQSEMTDENALEKRAEITKLILNNNAEGIKFTDEDIEKIPVKLQVLIHTQMSGFVYKINHYTVSCGYGFFKGYYAFFNKFLCIAKPNVRTVGKSRNS